MKRMPRLSWLTSLMAHHHMHNNVLGDDSQHNGEGEGAEKPHYVHQMRRPLIHLPYDCHTCTTRTQAQLQSKSNLYRLYSEVQVQLCC